jgi:hypothetical protein
MGECSFVDKAPWVELEADGGGEVDGPPRTDDQAKVSERWVPGRESRSYAAELRSEEPKDHEGRVPAYGPSSCSPVLDGAGYRGGARCNGGADDDRLC